MTDYSHCCIQCLLPKSSPQCPHCGDDPRHYPQHPLYLKPDTLLNQGQYRIGRVLGQGGFGITYMGLDTHLGKQVAIKEYLPSILASRDPVNNTVLPLRAQEKAFAKGLHLYIEEARNLAKFDHPNIVPVLNFFEENQTGYMVMTYLQGINVAQLLREQRKPLSLAQALSIITPVLTALDTLHQKNLYHLDISAQNVFIHHFDSKDKNLIFPVEQIILIDFGAAKCISDQPFSLSVSLILKSGYSPLEQYAGLDNIGGWSDVYACGALLYFLLSHRLPPSATERLSEDRLQPLSALPGLAIDKQTDKVIMTALAVQVKNRFPSVTCFQQALHTGKIHLRQQPTIAYRPLITFSLWASGVTLGFIGYIHLLSLQQESTVQLQLTRPQQTRQPAMIIASKSTSKPMNLQQFELLLPPALPKTNPKEGVSRQAEIDYWLNQAQTQQRLLRLTTPKGDNAFASYQRILQIQPENPQVQQGLVDMAQWYLNQAQHSHDKQQQLDFIEKGLSVQPEQAQLLALKQDILVKASDMTHNPVVAQKIEEKKKETIPPVPSAKTVPVTAEPETILPKPAPQSPLLPAQKRLKPEIVPRIPQKPASQPKPKIPAGEQKKPEKPLFTPSF